MAKKYLRSLTTQHPFASMGLLGLVLWVVLWSLWGLFMDAVFGFINNFIAAVLNLETLVVQEYMPDWSLLGPGLLLLIVSFLIVWLAFWIGGGRRATLETAQSLEEVINTVKIFPEPIYVDFSYFPEEKAGHFDIEVRFEGVLPSTEKSDLLIHFSDDGGTSFSLLKDHYYYESSLPDRGENDFHGVPLFYEAGTASLHEIEGWVRIRRPYNLSQRKQFSYEVKAVNAEGQYVTSRGNGVYLGTTDPLGSIRFLFSVDRFRRGTFEMVAIRA